MTTFRRREIDETLLYPDDDHEPRFGRAVCFRWISLIVEGLEFQFRDRADVFVAGALCWRVEERSPEFHVAPDVMAVFGRPRKNRDSYKQWREEGVAPQVVIDVRAAMERDVEMEWKYASYDRRGVEEYYLYDPDARALRGYLRRGGRLDEIVGVDGWTSPRLGVRFELEGPEGLTLRHPDGTAFRPSLEARVEALEQRRRADRLAARLRESGGRTD